MKKPGDMSYSVSIWCRYRENIPAVFGLIIVSIIIVSAVCSNTFTSFDPITQGELLTERYLPPSLNHLFGTDKFARDIFSRVLYGGRISLILAFSVVFLSVTIGVLYGSLSAYIGGRTDRVMMRFLDFLLAFPMIFLVIIIIALFQATHWHLIPILALTGWMETARFVRAEVLSLKEREFILAARGIGLSHGAILLRHIIPNCLTIVFVTVPIKIAEIILLESALSFLGIGVQPPAPSWGNIISSGREALLNAWWISTFPGFFITMTVMGFHLIGDGLKEALKAE